MDDSDDWCFEKSFYDWKAWVDCIKSFCDCLKAVFSFLYFGNEFFWLFLKAVFSFLYFGNEFLWLKSMGCLHQEFLLSISWVLSVSGFKAVSWKEVFVIGLKAVFSFLYFGKEFFLWLKSMGWLRQLSFVRLWISKKGVFVIGLKAVFSFTWRLTFTALFLPSNNISVPDPRGKYNVCKKSQTKGVLCIR